MDSPIRPALTLYAFIVVGTFLVFAPWTTIWEQAVLAVLPRSTGAILLQGWARGCVSGVGALDLVVAAQVVVELWRGTAAGVPGRVR